MAKRPEARGTIVERKDRELQAPNIAVNSFKLGCTESQVVINFALTAPSHLRPFGLEYCPAVRVIMPWDTAEELLNVLGRIAKVVKSARKSEIKTGTKGSG